MTSNNYVHSITVCQYSSHVVYFPTRIDSNCFHKLYWIVLRLCLAACYASLACFGLRAVEIPGPKTSVAIHHGVPTFFINEEPHGSTAFATYVPREKYYHQFSEAGTDLFYVSTNVGTDPYWHTTPVWVGKNVWDYSEFDESLNKILSANPSALLIPRIHIAEPEWWRDEHPEDLVVFDDGTTRTCQRRRPFRLWPAKKSRTYGSIASERWRKDMGDSLRRLLKHIHFSEYAENIAGYQLQGLNTEEWYYFTRGEEPGSQLGDYSEAMKSRFRQWLKEKYITDDQLRTAWRNPDVTLSSAIIPSISERSAERGKRPFRDPRIEMNVIDFYHCYNELIPDTIEYFAKIVKEETKGTKAVGAFYAYLFEFAGRPDTGHNAVEKLLQSEAIDFISVTASYGKRQLGAGGSIMRSPHTSLKLHGKLWKEDNDTVSFLFPEVSRRIGDNEWERSKVVLAATDTPEQSRWLYLRGAGLALGNGVEQVMFDLHGGYFDNSDLMDSVYEINKLSQRSLAHDRTSVAEVLVVADEVSTFYTTINSELLRQSLYDPPYQLIKMGTPYDSVYVNDLSRVKMGPYKLVIFLNAYHLTEDQRDLVERTVMTPGRTVLWCYDVGHFCGAMESPDVLSEITGIQLKRQQSKELIAPQIVLEGHSDAFTSRLTQGKPLTIGPSSVSSFPVIVQDPRARILGVYPETGKPNLAEKDVDGARSIYSITASLPSAFFRELARSAGVHIYNDRNDTLYVCHDYLTVNADGDGTRQLRFPQSVSLFNAVDDQAIASNVTEINIPFSDLETKVIRLERRNTN